MGLTVVVAILATLAAILVVAAAAVSVWKIRKSGKKVSWEWISRWNWPFQRQVDRVDPERDPLLSPQQADSSGNI